MSGFHRSVSERRCVKDNFLDTDFHSLLDTKRAVQVFYDIEIRFRKRIYDLENRYCCVNTIKMEAVFSELLKKIKNMFIINFHILFYPYWPN
jgi:hypothetical protein